jgi:hypothetical protein
MAYESQPNDVSIFRNTFKTDEKHPDYTGRIVLQDGTEKRISLWVVQGEKGKFFSGKISDPKPRELTSPVMDIENLDLPF